MPKISVIIPIYNAQAYLEEALSSAINQSFDDIEIICINDGSKDNSLEIIKNFAQLDSRIKIIDKQNSGYGASVNRGIDEASGEFIAIFEPDDILDKDIYKILYREAVEHNLDVIKGNYYNYWSKKGKNGKCKKSSLISKCALKKVFEPKNNLKIFTCHASVWAGIYRKSFLDSNNIRFLETPGASYQDMSFTFKVLASVDKMKLIDMPLLYYRQDNPNSSINNPDKVFCVCDEYDELTRFLDNHPEQKLLFNTQKLVNQYRAYLWNLKRLDTSLQTVFLQKYSETFLNYYNQKELTTDFYKSIKKSDLMLLTNNYEAFFQKIIKKNPIYWLNFRKVAV